MSNMSYCRFRNTLEDLQDCEDALNADSVPFELLSTDERQAARRLLQLCKKLAADFDGELE